MRKISAQLVSTKPISLSRAAKLMTRFASVDNGSSATVSIYIQRAAEALDSLVQFHDSSKSSMGSTPKLEISDGETTEKSRKRKGKIDEGTIIQECDKGDDTEVEKKKKRKKKKSDGKKRDKASDS